jgi:hypothetical protein
MILSARELEGIAAGTFTCAFRRWRRPSVTSGGTLLTAIGRLDVRAVEAVEAEAITDAEARRAGHASRAALIEALSRWPDGTLYRITFGAIGADPRVALRAEAPDAREAAVVRATLARPDAAAPGGAWTRRTLEAIRDYPGLRAADLCRRVGTGAAAVQGERPQAQGARPHREPRGRLPSVAARRRTAVRQAGEMSVRRRDEPGP